MADDNNSGQGNGVVLMGQNQNLALPIQKITKEMLDPKTNTVIKSELSDAELPAFIVAQTFTDIMKCPYHQMAIDTFLVSKMALKRKRVSEILGLVKSGGSEKPRGFMSRLFGGGRG